MSLLYLRCWQLIIILNIFKYFGKESPNYFKSNSQTAKFKLIYELKCSVIDGTGIKFNKNSQ